MAEKDEEKNQQTEQQASVSEEQQASSEDSSQEETANTSSEDHSDTEEKYNALNDKYLRLYSDFDNFRKRTIKEKADLISNASSAVLKDLLPVLDDFERAIASNENTEDIDGLKEGFQLIYSKFRNILVAKGLKPMESKGTIFDLDLHEAITNIPVEDTEMKGKVVDVVEKGYYLNDKVLRYAKVVVGQ
jgi:molecular chaperone GrpE